ncbi:AAA family ATPase [Spirosoma sp. HMF4905]|uniref:AAA family ATPase n=1 Tax=Spirosoma arboris TaxID=2682092 RepID=A0A7K1S6L2_9BACT|nr:ATP-binding protein [Spirosoma arboris]MVM29385.1 AAA family ATPase [Spirosoma arboris]
MARIDSIHINQFKFFADNDPIQLGGKHLLLYGENGSGKSSLFWALYTLLESVQKTDEHINRYFTQTDDASLVNVHAQPIDAGDWGAFIEATLTDGEGSYRVAVNDFSIKSRPRSQATLRASDFLNYRFMYKLHDCRHKDEINLFDLFQKEVFPYIITRAKFSLLHEPVETYDFNEIWDDLQKGVPALAEGEVSEDDQRREQKKFADKLRAFVEELKTLSSEINGVGNQLLREELGYPKIRFEVDCQQKFKPLGGRGELTGRDSDEPDGPLRLTLTIPEYDNIANVVRRPQSFLNEAKLTAIGIAIRLAILRRRSDYLRRAEFRILVLDDLLISLDMSNRRKVLDLLLKRYAPIYQLFILTHDRSFYHFAEKKIRIEYGQSDEWEFTEMYQDTISPIARPYFNTKKPNLKQAQDYFNVHDYSACGLYLRKECEKRLDELLPEGWKKTFKADGTSEPKNLNDKINSLEDFCAVEGIDYAPFRALKIYKDVILNTLAHNDIDSPLYRDELKLLMPVIKKLSTINRGTRILKQGEDLLFQVNNTVDGRKCTVGLRTRDSFVLLTEEDQPPRLSYFTKCEVRKVDRGTGWVDEHQSYDNINSLIEHYEQEVGVTAPKDLLNFLQYRNQPLRSKL